MKAFLFSYIFIFSTLFAGEYNCNIQMMPKNKAISEHQVDQYVKAFRFITPSTKKMNVSFKHMTATISDIEGKEIFISLKNSKKNYTISTSFLSSQEVLNITNDDNENIICWSQAAIDKSKYKLDK